MAQSPERWAARSMVISRYGVAATEHPLASQAAVGVLARGGNAVDAAVAANAVMGLVAPMSNGIGGDLFAIVYEARTGKLHGLNASGPAPAALTIEFLKSKGLGAEGIMPLRGIHTISVPGAVDGWAKLLERLGRLKFADVLAPAIRYAEEGFPVSEMVAGRWAANVELMKQQAASWKTFYPNGREVREGEIFRNPDLARSYKLMAAQGRDAYYKGEIAQRILALMKEMGGTMTAADLADFQSEWVDPIAVTYRGWTVYELPPQVQGIAALMMLNIMENFPLDQEEASSPARLHAMIEAKKLAYADMIRYVGDPRASAIPVAGMLSKNYGRERSRLIDANRANCRVSSGRPPAAGTDTVYLAVADREGNMVSLIQSNYENFGSGLTAAGTGFPLQNRAALFNLEPGSPNALAGKKRPLHTIIPAFMTRGEVRIAFGIMGGWNQAQAHAQFVSHVVDHRMNIQQALEAPRFTKLTFDGCDVRIESRFPEATRRALSLKGHQLAVFGPFYEDVGGGQAVLRDFKAGVNYGASDPRKDGAAIPEPPPLK
jgi:gamma-glutamyltranspeptidase/glutathione hydrolase